MGKVVELRRAKEPLTRNEALANAAALRVIAAKMARAAQALHARAGELEARSNRAGG